MTYNVFGGTLNLTQSTMESDLRKDPLCAYWDVICELLAVKHGDLAFTNLFINSVLDAFIEFLCSN